MYTKATINSRIRNISRHIPEDKTFRIRWLSASATYTAPLESTDTPEGFLKLAAAPVPSAQVAEEDPAKVDTTPVNKKQAMEIIKEYLFHSKKKHITNPYLPTMQKHTLQINTYTQYRCKQHLFTWR